MISLWEKESFYAPQDVIIVGCGFAGLWSAFYLKKHHPKLKVAIIEKDATPAGASSRNAGFACFGSLGEIVRDVQNEGADATLHLVEERYKGLQKIEKHFGKACGLHWCGGYELYGFQDIDAKILDTNLQYVNILLKSITGHKNIFSFADDFLPAFGFGRTAHLIKNEYEGYLHPGMLLKALLQAVQAMGVQIFFSANLHSFEASGNEIHLHTSFMPLTCRKLLLCTAAYTSGLLPGIDIVPARGQVLLTSPIVHLPFQGVFHAEEGYYYFRNVGDRVLLGGARHKAFDEEASTDAVTSSFIQDTLENYLKEVVLPDFEGQYSIEQRWAGIMAMGSSKEPLVREYLPNVFCAVRLGGMGVALAPAIGKKVMEIMS